jgi:phospholipid transport system substrate-binding protein
MLQPGREKSVRIDWRIRANEGTYKVVDILVEGISMSVTKRSEFASVIRRNGDNVEALLVELRKRLHNDT